MPEKGWKQVERRYAGDVGETRNPVTGETAAADELLTVDDVAQWLKVPPSWVYERTRRRGEGRLPVIKLGKYLRFEESHVRAYLERQRRSG